MLSAYPVNTGIAFHRMEGRFISSNFFIPQLLKESLGCMLNIWFVFLCSG